MAITLATLRSRVVDVTHREDLTGTAKLDFYINAAIRMLQQAGFFRPQSTSTTFSSSAITSGDTGLLSFTIPTRFKNYRDWIQTAPSYKGGFSRIARERANIVWVDQTTLANNIFEAVVVDGSTIDVYPPYTASASFAAGTWVFKLHYDEWLADLSVVTDSNYFTDNAYNVIVPLTHAIILTDLREFDDAINEINIARELANRFTIDEYGEKQSGRDIKLGDLQAITANISNKQLGG